MSCIRCGNHSGPSGYCFTCDPNREEKNRLAAIQRAVEAAVPVQVSPADDRASRIRALVREWIGNGTWKKASEYAFEAAAEAIDAIDDAEIPKKKEAT